MPAPTARRTFLKATLATGLCGLVRAPAPAASSAGVPGGDWVEAVRAELPGMKHSRGYFQTRAFGLSPQRVMDRTKELITRPRHLMCVSRTKCYQKSNDTSP